MITGLASAENALAPIKAVTYDSRGILQVDGKPFFPILLYGAPQDDATLAKLKDAGFNVLTTHTGADAAKLLAKGFYGAAHAGKKMDDASGVVLLMGTDSPVLVFKENAAEKTKAANDKARASCPDRPVMNAIGYWLNEPDGVEANVLPSKAQYEDVVNAADVAAPYLYPVPYQPVGTVGDATARAREATGGHKPLLPILQLFQWKNATRHATAEELRCMVYLSLIEGATGIGYYDYGSVKDPAKADPVVLRAWESVPALNKEIAAIGRSLIAGAKNTKITAAQNDGVKWLAIDEKTTDGKITTTILVANPGSKEATITFSGLPGGDLTIKLKSLESRTHVVR